MKESTVIEIRMVSVAKTHIIKISKEDNHYNKVKLVNKKKKSNINQTKKVWGWKLK